MVHSSWAWFTVNEVLVIHSGLEGGGNLDLRRRRTADFRKREKADPENLNTARQYGDPRDEASPGWQAICSGRCLLNEAGVMRDSMTGHITAPYGRTRLLVVTEEPVSEAG